jgi:urease accessory protein
MPRAIRVLPASERSSAAVIDTIILPYAQRQVHKGFLFGVKGTCIELDLDELARLRTDDALVLDDGGLVEIVAEPESLIEVRAGEAGSLARLAWHLGDRHVAVQVLERRLRVRREPAIETLLVTLGAKPVGIEAPFEPEGGAYEAAPADHHHHNHPHDHAHGHGNHSHGHDAHAQGPHDHGHDHHNHAHERKPD